MVANPCCGGDLQKGTRIVAIVEIIWYVLELLTILGLLFAILVFGVVLASAKNEQSKNDPEASANWGLIAVGAIAFTVFGLLLCFFTIISLIFGIILLKGSNNRDLGKCKAWLIFRGIMFVLALFSFLLGNIFGIWEVLVSPYFIWVTYAYMQELKTASRHGQGVVYSQPRAQDKV